MLPLEHTEEDAHTLAHEGELVPSGEEHDEAVLDFPNPGEVAHKDHATHVHRLQPDQEIEMYDEEGNKISP